MKKKIVATFLVAGALSVSVASVPAQAETPATNTTKVTAQKLPLRSYLYECRNGDVMNLSVHRARLYYYANPNGTINHWATKNVQKSISVIERSNRFRYDHARVGIQLVAPGKGYRIFTRTDLGVYCYGNRNIIS